MESKFECKSWCQNYIGPVDRPIYRQKIDILSVAPKHTSDWPHVLLAFQNSLFGRLTSVYQHTELAKSAIKLIKSAYKSFPKLVLMFPNYSNICKNIIKHVLIHSWALLDEIIKYESPIEIKTYTSVQISYEHEFPSSFKLTHIHKMNSSTRWFFIQISRTYTRVHMDPSLTTTYSKSQELKFYYIITTIKLNYNMKFLKIEYKHNKCKTQPPLSSTLSLTVDFQVLNLRLRNCIWLSLFGLVNATNIIWIQMYMSKCLLNILS